jgi:hypothetical protein
MLFERQKPNPAALFAAFMDDIYGQESDDEDPALRKAEAALFEEIVREEGSAASNPAAQRFP